MRSFIRLLLAAALCALVPTAVRAQRLVVHVHSDGGPAAGAAVTLLALPDTSRRVATAADTAGDAIFDSLEAGRYRIHVVLDGYEAVSREVRVDGQVTRIDVELHESAVTLPGIVAQADRQRARFRESAGATVTELSQRDLKMVPALGEADVLRAIDVLPGVVSTSDFSSAFNVRGGSADENLILLDGFPIYNPFHLGGLFSVFNADMVKRAELLSGGFPAQYGGRVSSVLNIESDAGGGSEPVQGGVSLLAARAAVSTDLPKRVLSSAGLVTGRARLSLRRSYFDQLLKPVFDFPYHLTDAQLFADGSSANGSRVTLTGYSGHDVLDLAGLDSFPLQVRWHWGNDVIGGTWTRPMGGNRTIETRAGFTRFQTAITFPQFDDTEFSSRISQAILRFEMSARARRTTWRTGVSAEWLSYHNLAQTAGTVFGENHDRGALLGTFVQQSTRASAWLIETGLRADAWMPRDGSTSFELQPRVAVKRFIGGENVALKAAVGRYAQFAHSIRDEELPLGIDVWVLSGTRAPVVVSDQAQGGIEAFMHHGWHITTEAYYRTFRGVTANNAAENPDDESDDLLRGTGTSYGADMQIRRDAGRVRPMLAVSWLKAERTFDDIGADPVNPPKLAYPPVFDRRLDVDLVVQAELPREWMLGVRLNIGTGLPYTRPLAGYTEYDYSLLGGTYRVNGTQDTSLAVVLGPRNGERYPVYHRLDAGIHRTFRKRWGTLTPTLDVLNVYDRRNVLFYFYQYDENPPTRSGVSMFPLLPTLGLEIRF